MKFSSFSLVFLTVACGPAAKSGAGDGDGGTGHPDAPGAMACAPNATEPCYDGTTGTEGVGPCHGGMRTCASDGSAWLACQGEVIPAGFETCANSIDDDCNGQVDDVVDIDGDGYTRCTGDCCETTMECGDPVKVNPGAAEAPTMMGGIPVDDNCNGTVDEPTPTCDGALAVDDADPVHGAWAIDLCQAPDPMTGLGSGLISAQYVRADGSPIAVGLQAGLLPDFGPNVMTHGGTRLLALSSGHGRRAADPGACGSLSCSSNAGGTAPPGFPQDTPGCSGGTAINDDVGLEVHLKAPSNATGFSVDFSFYTFEYPEWVCTTFNDQFIVLVNPPPPGSINGNIAFDSMTRPVSVNIAYFDVCQGCPMGTAALAGTGFDTWNDAGATGWLRSQAPVTPGEDFTIRFTIWDTGDSAWDSTVILDNFQWILEGSPGVMTNPIG